ncbi:MAG: RsmB/NOP family class I SAM-dependent RNA methyltransferase [Alphaproteobacteria bacterium]|nr:RsmB/NOP family class I SAM-dependent RNA methyltransferase [Alphaproteobacteria bacterium]
MKEASRVQAVIDVLEEVMKDLLPADVLLEKYFKARRYIGAKDRRFIGDTVWGIIRQRIRLSKAFGQNASPRLLTALYLKNQDLELLFNGEEYAPAVLSEDEKKALAIAKTFEAYDEADLYECPKWLFSKFSDKKLLEALNETAPVDVRANFISREQAKDRLRKEGLFFSPTPFSPIGLRSTERVNLKNAMTFQDGDIEVMDEASQVISLLCNAKAHHKIMDYCAGAGGKALALGALMHNDGVVFAHDINQERLSRIKKRAERLGVLNIKLKNTVEDSDYDRFILDAPCSGSGVWRRAPDAKFRLSPQKLEDIVKTQQELLEFGAKHTKSGGRLIYITCSVFNEENEKQIEAFLQKHPEFFPLNHKELWQKTLDLPVYPFEGEKWLHFSPLTTKTDGFFFCALGKQKD